VGRTLIFFILISIVTTLVYSNHFNNSFHFDDSHTIENNVYIRSITNIPAFFTDATTFSSLPQNQSYRPLVSASLAVDYYLGGGYNYFYFHLDSFIIFLLQGFLMFYLFYQILQRVLASAGNFYIAAFAASWYMLHPASAETINYVIARSDLQSTFFVIAGFVLYIGSAKSRKYHLYLIPVAIGALAKPTAVMFAPMLLFYILLFEKKLSLAGIFSRKELPSVGSAFVQSVPAFVICTLMYLFIDHMTPETWMSGGTSRYEYLITQPYVILHYFTTFFFPAGLSADTDWTVLTSIMDKRFFIGMAFILMLVMAAFWLSKDKRLRPISFGIIWFFLALVPSSSVIPFAEVLNDHRIFFPYVGLSLSVCWTLGLLARRFIMEFKNVKAAKITLTATTLLILSAYAYGTHQRNEVWLNDETLWYDVTVKSPKNGRGLMNYGLSKMQKGDYPTAEIYFKKALEIWPNYSFIHVNMGVLKSATGDPHSAEKYFRQACELGPGYPDSWFFYGKFLHSQGRTNEAEPALSKALDLSPAHSGARSELLRLYFNTGKVSQLKDLAEATLKISPTNTEAQNYLKIAAEAGGQLPPNPAAGSNEYTALIDLSLLHFNQGDYKKCIETCVKALTIEPRSAAAYNNIGISYLRLGDADKSIAACQKALEIDPSMQLAKNNLLAALKMKEAPQQQKGLPIPLTAEEHLNQSLTYYQNGQYEDCIKACEEALKLKPDYADAYSNICASYNQLRQWDKAIAACNKALKIDATHRLATGNLNWAKEEKARTKK
jgi:tetratricopeptide (TPR) repeat protein